MPLQKSKKIFIYIFLFLIFATFNNKNLNDVNFFKIIKISIQGLDDKNNFELVENLDFLMNKNIFLLDKVEIENTIEINSLVERYSVFILYPSSIKIKIHKTNFLALVKKGNNNFLLGSNGKLIKADYLNNDLPYLSERTSIDEFLHFTDVIKKSIFELEKIIFLKKNNIKNNKHLFITVMPR